MKICHVALGGCLTAPHVNYGVTEDTGGHIAYVLGAAYAQAARQDVTKVEIVTRAFDAPDLGAVHAQSQQHVAPKLSIRRIWGTRQDYLTKEALAAEVPALCEAFIDYLYQSPHKPDLIHAHFADAAELALAARGLFGIPVVYTPHSLALTKTTATTAARRINSETRALDQSDATIVSSRNESDLQVTAYGPGLQARVRRIAPGVTTQQRPNHTLVKTELGPFLDDTTRPVILAIARPVRRKNLTTLARVYAQSPALQAKANLVILGGQHDTATAGNAELRDELGTLKKILSVPALDGKVALPAKHTRPLVDALYGYAAETGGVFCNVAWHEPFGLTILEAAAAGLPVVATNAGGPGDIIDDLKCGLAVDPNDADAIGSAITTLLSDRETWQAAAAAGKTGVGRYDWTRWASEADAVYRDIQQIPSLSAPSLLISDIDHTLTGNIGGSVAFAAWAAGRHAAFAVATGRSVTEARRVLAQSALPTPDAMITSVGSELYLPGPDGRLMFDTGFATWINTGWDRDTVLSTLTETGFAFQPAVEQRRWKLSGYGDAENADMVKQALRDRGLHTHVIASHGRLIDILPLRAGKANAATYLARRMGVPPARVVVAGDSGNDLDMLQAVGLGQTTGIGNGILVGNALPELTEKLNNPAVYHATRHHADGVLEGLAAIGFAGQSPGYAGAAE